MVDEFENVYVTGTSFGIGTYWDYVTIKYNNFGEEQWIARFNAGLLDEAKAIAVDSYGNVYVTGTIVMPETYYDYATVKYSVDGVEQWVAIYNSPENGRDEPISLGLDESGNVYVTGNSLYGSEKHYDYATIKYNADGIEQWVRLYNGAKSSKDKVIAFAVDNFGNVFVTGESVGPENTIDYTTIKYDSAGTEQWVSRYNDGIRSIPTALTLDKLGNVYVTGYSYNSGVDNDCITVKYDDTGAEQWVMRYNGTGNTDDEPVAVRTDNMGNVIVAGSSTANYWSVYTTIKYRQTPVTGKKQKDNPVRTFSLSQNYPNPFNPTTTIHFSLPNPEYVILKIFNLIGQEIATLISEKKQAGEHNIQWDASDLTSGIYIYRLQAGNFADTKKLLLLK